MLFVAGPVPEILRFIQVLCWIIVPLLIAAVAIAAFLHYRNRKRDEGEHAQMEGKLRESVSALVGYTNGNGEYVVFDNSVLIQQYKNKLSYNHARYTALQHDLARMETKYAALALYARNLFVKPKKEVMENSSEQMPIPMQADINRLAMQHATEKKELQDKLAQLERSCRQLEEENKVLQEQVHLKTATEDEKAEIINKWKEENASLRDKVSDHEYLEDLVEEKKAQVNFLQNQLEQRIKNLYQSEHQRLQVVAEMKQIKEERETAEKKIGMLQNELMLKQDLADKTQVIICGKEEQLAEKDQVLNEKLEHISQLERMLQESRQQNESMNVSLTETKNLTGALQQQLADEQARVDLLAQRLSAHKQAIRRLHKEFSEFIDDAEGSPVIALNPEYSNGHGAI
jgi:chromosome segregation ATPase